MGRSRLLRAALVAIATLTATVAAEHGAWEPIYQQGMELYKDVKTVHMCDGDDTTNWYIYCAGPILEAVNYHKLYNDSKHFVDMPLKFMPAKVEDAFNNQFGSQKIEQIDKAALQAFVDANFSPPGAELQDCTPSDWQEKPARLMKIEDPVFRAWALELNALWKHLCKKIRPEIYADIAKYSIIPIPDEFIVPGGRFREPYYFDSYWIVKGLLASEMYTTTRQVIYNFQDMINRYGFIPNGGRIYYLRRSQPPLLTGMVYDYYEATHDKDFLREILPTLEKEMEHWDGHRTVGVKLPDGFFYNVYLYRTESNVPRPEAYVEDMEASKGMNDADKEFLYRALASAAESGWDFSTRWFKDRKHRSTAETHEILPVDLNSIICWNFGIMEYLNEQVGDFTKAKTYRDRRSNFLRVIEAIFYNETTGAWHDYNMRLNRHNTEFYSSVAVPLFTNSYLDLDQTKSERLFQYTKDIGAFSYPNGVPQSQIQGTGEQWDFPNGWSPSNHMLIEGLRKAENPEMQDQAFQIAKKWVYGNYRVFHATKHMWEKYDVIGSVPAPGKGGEYQVQDGFGWTNGVILDLLLTYNDRLAWSDGGQSSGAGGTSASTPTQQTNPSNPTKSTNAPMQSTTKSASASYLSTAVLSLSVILLFSLRGR